MHPGGAAVFMNEGIRKYFPSYIQLPDQLNLILSAGEDATEAFYSLHRNEILEKPQFARLQIGVVVNETPQLYGKIPGSISKVPYAEPTWLTEGYTTPYYTEVIESYRAIISTLLTCPYRATDNSKRPYGNSSKRSFIRTLRYHSFHTHELVVHMLSLF